MADVSSLVAALVKAQREIERATVLVVAREADEMRELGERCERLQILIRESEPSLEDGQIDRKALRSFEDRLQFGADRLRDCAHEESESTHSAWGQELDRVCLALEETTIAYLGGGSERWP